MNTEIALDLMLIVLLCTTVGYCVVLDRRLTRLRDGQSEFKELIGTLTAATDKAEASLKELRELTDSTSSALSKNIKAGRELVDELSMITETGNALANRIEITAYRWSGESCQSGRRGSPARREGRRCREGNRKS